MSEEWSSTSVERGRDRRTANILSPPKKEIDFF